MKQMSGEELQKHLQENNLKWAVAIFNTDGVPRATICTVDGIAFAMDLEMLRGVVPLLQKCINEMEKH
jgi:DNA-binding IclR family transcriptional regulator